MYERMEELLRLALLMQGARSGLSLADIQTEFEVSRSTAERMRDAVLRAFPQAELVPHADRVKRWRLPAGVLNRSIGFEASEIDELRLAADRLRQEGLGTRADALERVRAKLLALLPQQAKTRLEPDLEALLEVEGHAMRPGPRPEVPAQVLQVLREALIGCRTLRAHYRRRIGGRSSTVEVEPHGLLFGQRHYLVAYPARSNGGAKLYALGNLSKLELTERGFNRRAGFDLAEYAAGSFGVFQEEPIEVTWRFGPASAADALEHHFHQSERKVARADGGLDVHFRAGGMLEMCWHLFTWGEAVEVVAPAALRERYQALLQAAQSSLTPQPTGRAA